MLSLYVSLAYQLAEDEEKEKLPHMNLWLSQTLSDKVHTVQLAKGTQQGTIDLALQFPLSQSSVTNNETIWTANLNIDLWSVLSNLHGERASDQAGSIRIPLAELLLTCADQKQPKEYSVSIPSLDAVLMENGKVQKNLLNYKGKLVLSCSRWPLILNNKDNVPVPPASLLQVLQKVEQWKELVYAHYMGSCVQLFKQIKATWDITDDINVYRYKCRVGTLPAAAYLGNRLGNTSPAFFINALKIVLARHKLRLEQFDRNSSKAASVLGAVLCLVDTYMAYVPDIVFLPKKGGGHSFKRFPLESFDLALIRGGGDCEDMALEICLEAAELAACAARGGTLSANAAETRALSELIHVRQLFVFTMALGGVSSAEINGDYSNCSRDDMGAHMWSMAIPCWLWFEMWARGNSMPQTLLARYRDRIEESRRRFKYPMILEGTGLLEPESYDHNDGALKDDVCQVLEVLAKKGFGGLRKWFRYTRGKRSTFYKTCCVFLTNEFLLRQDGTVPDKEKYVLFGVCRKNSEQEVQEMNHRRRTQRQRTRDELLSEGKQIPPSLAPEEDNIGPLTLGVPFEELTGDFLNNCLWAEPPLNELEAECIRDSMKDLPPRPAIVPPLASSSIVTKDSLVAQLKTLGNSSSSSSESTTIIEYFIKDVLVTPQKISDIMRAKSELDIVKRVVEVVREDVASAPHPLGGYRIVLECYTGETFRRARRKASEIVKQQQQQQQHDVDEDDF